MSLTRKVDDGRLVVERVHEPGTLPKNWSSLPLYGEYGSIEVGYRYTWEPGDMTRYEMGIISPDHDAGTGAVMVLIKNKAVLLQFESLTFGGFEELFQGLPFLDSLPLRYQYIRAIHCMLDIPIDQRDMDETVRRLREINYPAFWPEDQ